MKRVVALALLAVVACGEPPPKPVRREIVSHWQDVFDSTPDIYAVVRPRAFRRDPLYGSFWKSLVRVAQARRYLSGASMLEALEGSEEVILGLDKGADATLIARGVPASLDPARLVDEEGKSWFRARDDRTRVVEYEVLAQGFAGQGALFVLPDRTWIAALGPAKQRARQAYTTPMNRPLPKVVDDDVLAMLQLSGGATRLFHNNLTVRDLFESAQSVSFTLKPGSAGLVLALAYGDPSRTAFGEAQAKQVIERLAKDEKTSAWAKGASAKYEGNTVFVRLQLPPHLLEALPNTSGKDLGTD